MPKTYEPQCLTCSHKIAGGEEREELILGPNNKRFRHATWEGCQRAMAPKSVMSSAEHKHRLEQHAGHAANMPGLDAMEEWGK